MGKLEEEFGSIDIYLFDQLLRENIRPGMRVLDAGFGSGRNLVYLLREGYEVFGVDQRLEMVEHVRSLAGMLAPKLDASGFRLEAIERMSFPDACADVVICNSVLHFARDGAQFEEMVRGLWKALRPGGLLFARLGSTIGGVYQRIEGRKFLLPGGAEWYLVDEPMLMELTDRLGGALVDPLKTTVVQGSRSMTTWVVRKDG